MELTRYECGATASWRRLHRGSSGQDEREAHPTDLVPLVAERRNLRVDELKAQTSTVRRALELSE